MFGLPLAFAAPAVLAALIGLVGLYFLLRLTPPAPHRAIFPPLRLLIGLDPNETTPARTPWPILALRLRIGAASGSDRRRVCRCSGVGQANRLRSGTSDGGGEVRSNRGDRAPLAGRAGCRAARQIRG